MNSEAFRKQSTSKPKLSLEMQEGVGLPSAVFRIVVFIALVGTIVKVVSATQDEPDANKQADSTEIQKLELSD